MLQISEDGAQHLHLSKAPEEGQVNYKTSVRNSVHKMSI